MLFKVSEFQDFEANIGAFVPTIFIGYKEIIFVDSLRPTCQWQSKHHRKPFEESLLIDNVSGLIQMAYSRPHTRK